MRFLEVLTSTLTLVFSGFQGNMHLTKEVELRKTYLFEVNVSNWVGISQRPSDTNQSLEHCRRMEAGPATPLYPEVLEKSDFEENPAFLFVAGLEGTGHHLLQKIFQQCENCTCLQSWEKNKNLKSFSLSKLGNKKGFFGSDMLKEEYEVLVSDFQRKAPGWKEVYKDKTVVLNTLCGGDGISQGMLSYPNYGGVCKAFKYPDVRLLGELMESEGMNFKVIVLLRNPIDVLLSTSLHRSMGSLEEVVRRYTTLANTLTGQLRRLDRRFFECVDYDSLASPTDEFLRFVDFERIGFDFVAAVKRVFRSSKTAYQRQFERERFIAMDEQNSIAQLVDATNEISSLCGLQPYSMQ